MKYSESYTLNTFIFTDFLKFRLFWLYNVQIEVQCRNDQKEFMKTMEKGSVYLRYMGDDILSITVKKSFI